MRSPCCRASRPARAAAPHSITFGGCGRVDGMPSSRLSARRRTLSRSNTVDLDVKRSGPGGNADKYPGGRVRGKITSIDRIDGCEFLNRGAIHVAFEHVLQERARRLEAELHLFQNKLGLAFDRGFDHLSGVGVEGRKPGDVDRVAAARNGRGRRLPVFQAGRQGSTRMTSRFMGALLELTDARCPARLVTCAWCLDFIRQRNKTRARFL
jgi:hypothetical protein